MTSINPTPPDVFEELKCVESKVSISSEEDDAQVPDELTDNEMDPDNIVTTTVAQTHMLDSNNSDK